MCGLHQSALPMIRLDFGDLSIPKNKLNVSGGVIAPGHPMGATGAIVAGMLLDELERGGMRRSPITTSEKPSSGLSNCSVRPSACIHLDPDQRS